MHCRRAEGVGRGFRMIIVGACNSRSGDRGSLRYSPGSFEFPKCRFEVCACLNAWRKRNSGCWSLLVMKTLV